MLLSLVQLAVQNLIYFALHLEMKGEAFPRQLTKDEEADCLARMEQGDHAARNKLIEHNLRLVAYIVNKKYPDAGQDKDDLLSIGIIGLIRAAETFKCDKNFNFSTYASKCIDNQIKMHFRKDKKYRNDVSMNEPVSGDGDSDGSLTRGETYKSPVNIEEIIESRTDCRRLYECINRELTPREKEIISKRYGLLYFDGTVVKSRDVCTQNEVAEQLKISRSYVSRIEKKALGKLRNAFGNR